MSVSVPVSTADRLVADFRELRLTRTQLVAALVAAGASTAGAVALVTAVSASHQTPTPIVANGGHVTRAQSATASRSAVAAHVNHTNLQVGH